MALRSDYAGNDMRRCDYAGNGLNFRSLQGQGYIWWSFGSYLTIVSQHQTTVVSWDNEPDHLHMPQPPTASSEGGMAGCFSDKEGTSFTQLKVWLWRLERGESRALGWNWTRGCHGICQLMRITPYPGEIRSPRMLQIASRDGKELLYGLSLMRQ